MERAAHQNVDFNIKAHLPILATAYGEGADQPYEVKKHIISSILNRAESGREEFGAHTGNISDVLKTGYYAYSKNSPKFQEAIDQKFPDKISEDSFKEFIAIYSGMLRGTVDRTESLFFLKPSEVRKIKKNKSMNMDLLEKIDSQGDFDFYKYKTISAGRRKNKNK